MKRLRIKHGQERRILEGYLWVFSNQLEDSVKDYSPGEIVRITQRNGRFLGVGYINPHSLIAARILTREEVEIDTDFFISGMRRATGLRRKVLPGEEAVREVYSESDHLPGLIIDRYKDLLVLSINTAGMDQLKPLLMDALSEVYQPAAVYERSDAGFRQMEGLEPATEWLTGEKREGDHWVKFEGLSLPVDVVQGQKTGLYLDQRLNLRLLASQAENARVLDAFSYCGAWGLKAAKSGAAEVTFVDSSAWALDQAQKAARRARLTNCCKTIKSDVLTSFKSLTSQKQRFDLIFLDPPSFIKSKSRFKEGYRGYFDLNQKALALLEPGGILVTSSCSHHMREEIFYDLLNSVLKRSQRQGKILYKGRQGPDHPVLPMMPETEYLHCLALQVD